MTSSLHRFFVWVERVKVLFVCLFVCLSKKKLDWIGLDSIRFQPLGAVSNLRFGLLTRLLAVLRSFRLRHLSLSLCLLPSFFRFCDCYYE